MFTHLMIHCSATPSDVWFDRKDIEKWHLEERGWSRVGYSALFLLDGKIDILIPFDKDDVIDSWEISNGARGWNGKTRHICYIGGLDDRNNLKSKDTRSFEQLIAMETFVKMHTMLWPSVKLIGHNQVSKKDCPSFSVPDWCEHIGINKDCIDYNIYT